MIYVAFSCIPESGDYIRMNQGHTFAGGRPEGHAGGIAQAVTAHRPI